ncbi:MAG: hypothetical protein U0234_31225 [Sandaracinus sp.]
MRNVLGSTVLLVSSGLLALGCSCSALVDIPCEQGYVACERQCVRVYDDPLHCGGCGVVCPSGVCTAGVCEGGSAGDGGWEPGDGSVRSDAGAPIDPDAGVAPDGAAADAWIAPGDAMPGDAGVAALDAWSDGTDAWSADRDGGVPVDLDAAVDDAALSTEDAAISATDAGDTIPICDLGETPCGSDCVLLGSDATHCGACDVSCTASEVCSAGTCVTRCDPGLTACGRDCVDTTTSPMNCGGCGIVCPTGICVDSECVAGYAGHLVVIGHDYTAALPPMDAVLGNAVHLGTPSMPRVLRYRGAVRAASALGIEASLARGRPLVVEETADPSAVPALLAADDVFLVYPQPDAAVEDLEALGTTWSRALTTFLARGGTIVALDAPPNGEEDSEGAVAWLAAAGLVDLVPRRSATGQVLTVVAPADALAVGLPLAYRAQVDSVRWFGSDLPAVIAAPEGAVVMHRTVVP